MNDRKQHVIQKAHQLFIEKGFQSTSIQDILDYSGIAKGTFYNYFSSKNELLIELFKSIFLEIEAKRNELLIGQDPSDIEVFIKQIETQLITNKKNKLLPLFEEVLVSHDEDLKDYLKQGQLRMIHWIHGRLQDLFDDSKSPYLLDSSIMFLGILHHNIKYYKMLNNTNAGLKQIVRYSVNRVVTIVEDLGKSEQQLFKPELLQIWLPEAINSQQNVLKEITQTVFLLKKELSTSKDSVKYTELLDFIHDDLIQSKHHRQHLVESVLTSLKNEKPVVDLEHFKKLTQLIEEFFNKLEHYNLK
ncbi:TetR/AcrR family transcriptional regulator [Litchfieldia salsa]|uniref:DNA-binding transcriptional regulator, AcrR family n=1 Tax=Litchfieldia salsa TaxID=930152 RepID=A0A1H0VXK4_9BACI|nr:TetR/AcrR family transcriptional regulator [Litchfieldia salsa]SDP83170.1 DNA-binding transcriptional regulator, AcrR family [Litchfieldia salsa]